MTIVSTVASTSSRKRAILSRAGLAVSLLTVVTGCSGTGSSPASGASPSSSASQRGGAGSGVTSAMTVEVKNFAFAPGNLTVAVGTKVTWHFDDASAHTVKAGNGSFTSSALQKGKSFSFTFNKAGTYQYICSIHQYMTGTITVK